MTSNIEYINKIQGASCYDETQYKQALRVSCENTNRISVELSRPLHQFYEVIVLESSLQYILHRLYLVHCLFRLDSKLCWVFSVNSITTMTVCSLSPFLLLVYNDSFKVVYDLKKNELRVVIN